MLSSRATISMLLGKFQVVVICTHFLKLDLSLEKFYFKWDSMRCQHPSLLKAHSGTLIHSSNLKVIQLETCTILSSLKIQCTLMKFQKNTKNVSAKHMRMVLRVHLVMEKAGLLKKQERTSSELIPQLSALK